LPSWIIYVQGREIVNAMQLAGTSGIEKGKAEKGEITL
jgi:hypothetical protein